MTYEVVVVGGGIGGLTVAALLAKRGLGVCLLERESQPGGCARTFEKFGYSFEPGAGLYHGWNEGGIHEQVFTELSIDAPKTRVLEPSYLIRLPDNTQVAVTHDTEQFEASLRTAFPECAAEAIEFYRDARRVSLQVIRTMDRVGDLPSASWSQLLGTALRAPAIARYLWSSRNDTVANHLSQTSNRFRRFIDLQLQTFTQSSSEECSYLFGSVALEIGRQPLFAIAGGPTALVGRLEESIQKSGGVIRCNAPVLRLAYDSSGRAAGVDLLSGERVNASRAIVSNLTVWDTYGKLVGLNRTPAQMRHRLKSLRGWGAYMLYLGMDEEAAQRLQADRLLVLTDWQDGKSYAPHRAQFAFAATPQWDLRAPAEKRAVTVHTFTEAEDWFQYHESEVEHETQDQAALEEWWAKVHAALPELGSGIEVIETATPRTYYELTRRRLGMVGGIGQALEISGLNSVGHSTSISNLFMVGDTTFPGAGIATVTHGALICANKIKS
ncbi:MAG TPA: FAD-dependent oxidoreductase [Pyrinomonadaceae bacterium]|nr:FAD-dependent oxidoreductase [Pyrinomonadaceae bacterium]